VASTVSNLIVRYNTINEAGIGISTGLTSSQIYYNQFINNNVAVNIQSCLTVDISNNTFYNNKFYSVESMENTRVSISNCIFYTGDKTTKTHNLLGAFTANYNIYNIENQGFTNGYNTLMQWQQATGQDKNSRVADPGFYDGEKLDLRLKSTSPCINRGYNNDLKHDFFGTSLPQGGIQDIGFFESVITGNGGTLPGNGSDIDPSDSLQILKVFRINAYPNPTTGILHISVDQSAPEDFTVTIIDVFGRVILLKENNQNQEVIINLQDQIPGTYFALIKVQGQVISRKLILQH
jgi:hypothetical protein